MLYATTSLRPLLSLYATQVREDARVALGVLAEVYRAARLLWPLDVAASKAADGDARMRTDKACGSSDTRTIRIGKLVGRRSHHLTRASARWALIQVAYRTWPRTLLGSGQNSRLYLFTDDPPSPPLRTSFPGERHGSEHR